MAVAKHRVVLHRANTRPQRVVFTRAPDEAGDVPDVLYLAESMWCELGEPDSVTVTVQAGDLLNKR